MSGLKTRTRSILIAIYELFFSLARCLVTGKSLYLFIFYEVFDANFDLIFRYLCQKHHLLIWFNFDLSILWLSTLSVEKLFLKFLNTTNKQISERMRGSRNKIQQWRGERTLLYKKEIVIYSELPR